MNFQLPPEAHGGPFQLPTEVVTRIFNFVCQGHTVRLSLRSHYSSGYPHPHVLLAPVVLSQVCRDWREIVLDTPSLWSNIFIDGSNVARQPVQNDFSVLLSGIEEVLWRTKAQAVRLIVRPPDLDRRLSSLGTSDICYHWQAVVNFLFGLDGTLGFNCTQLHVIRNALGLAEVDLMPLRQITLEDSSLSLHDWLNKQSTPERVSRWPKKMAWLSRNITFPHQPIQAFRQIKDLAIITPSATVNLDDLFTTLERLPQLISLRMNLGYQSKTKFRPRNSETLTLPHLRTLELQNCERTFLQCLSSVRLPVLANFDWIIAAYTPSSNVDVEGALARNAPALYSVRVCYLQSCFWSTERQSRRPASFGLTSTADHYKSWAESLSISRLDPTTFLQNFSMCRRSPNHYIPKVAPAYIEEIHSIPYVGRHWKAELGSPHSEVQARHVRLDPADILSLKRALKVLGSVQIPGDHRSLEVVLGYP
ncbi:hypothetical protein BKA70DRAFT_1415880 [Coprinopsis sp. MPI-PUGE-AT-0042]|nr:hypothetical protein BKA70DRAFT_1415880 [Coprinopsis sp. MPI-PUGE-AT-0042]